MFFYDWTFFLLIPTARKQLPSAATTNPVQLPGAVAVHALQAAPLFVPIQIGP